MNEIIKSSLTIYYIPTKESSKASNCKNTFLHTKKVSSILQIRFRREESLRGQWMNINRTKIKESLLGASLLQQV